MSCENDPVRVAWRALAPVEAKTEDPDGGGGFGACGRCGFLGVLTPVSDVVSVNFTGWDGLARDAAGLCAACAWAHREPLVRQQGILVEESVARFADRAVLSLVMQQPFTPAMSATVPEGRRKHLLPSAQWGCVTTDDGTFEWDAAAAKMTRNVVALRSRGMTDAGLLSGQPGTVLFADPASADAALRLWESLLEWRGAPQFAAAVVVSRAVRP